jgi:hypothetical protein
MNNKLKPEIAEQLIELMLSQVSEAERRRNPCLLKWERQMRDSLRQLKDLAKHSVSEMCERSLEEDFSEELQCGGARCEH